VGKAFKKETFDYIKEDKEEHGELLVVIRANYHVVTQNYGVFHQ
jgi:hypothetical protein